jgi:hypothetical protein
MGQVQLCTKEPEPDIWLEKQRVELEIMTGKLNLALIRLCDFFVALDFGFGYGVG